MTSKHNKGGEQRGKPGEQQQGAHQNRDHQSRGGSHDQGGQQRQQGHTAGKPHTDERNR